LLGVPWSSSAGVTGAALFDQVQRRRQRRGGRVLDEAGVVPDLERTGQQQLEPELDWPVVSRRVDSGRPVRELTAAELDAAAVVHFYDRRGSYLAPSGGADLPVGVPTRVEADAAHQVIDKVIRFGGERLPVGIWQVSLPKWDESMPPPHPDQHRFERVTRWVTTPTLQLLIDHDDIGGAGYTVQDLQPGPAWIWPEHGRLLEPWYKQVREALLAARSDGDDPVDRALKGVYTAYIGRMDYAAVAAVASPAGVAGRDHRFISQRIVAGHAQASADHRPDPGLRARRRGRLPGLRSGPDGQSAGRGYRRAGQAQAVREPPVDRFGAGRAASGGAGHRQPGLARPCW
jgi:hypothetical protein